MKKLTLWLLCLSAIAIFGFVAASSATPPVSPPGTEEYSREATEWQSESAEMFAEQEGRFEDLENGPGGGGGGGGGGGCDYSGGWCPPSCMSCTPAY